MSYTVPPEDSSYKVPNSNMAIVSLIAGILGLTFFPFLGSIVALVTGSMAKKEIRESAGTLGGEGMATAGSIMGWVGIGLSAIGFCVVCVVFALIPLGILSGEFSMFPAVLAPLI